MARQKTLRYSDGCCRLRLKSLTSSYLIYRLIWFQNINRGTQFGTRFGDSDFIKKKIDKLSRWDWHWGHSMIELSGYACVCSGQGSTGHKWIPDALNWLTQDDSRDSTSSGGWIWTGWPAFQCPKGHQRQSWRQKSNAINMPLFHILFDLFLGIFIIYLHNVLLI